MQRGKSFVALALIVGILATLGFFLYNNKVTKEASYLTTPTFDDQKKGDVQINFEPKVLNLSQSDNFEFSLILNTKEEKIIGIDTEFVYDQAALTMDEIIPQEGLSNLTEVLKNEINQEQGYALYSAFTLQKENALMGDNIRLFTIRGSVKPSIKPGEYLIGLGPKTAVAASGKQENVLSPVEPLKLVIR